jgi:hypothetical protein
MTRFTRYQEAVNEVGISALFDQASVNAGSKDWLKVASVSTIYPQIY